MTIALVIVGVVVLLVVAARLPQKKAKPTPKATSAPPSSKPQWLLDQATRVTNTYLAAEFYHTVKVGGAQSYIPNTLENVIRMMCPQLTQTERDELYMEVAPTVQGFEQIEAARIDAAERRKQGAQAAGRTAVRNYEPR